MGICNLIDFSLDEINDVFELNGNRLFRVGSSSPRFKHQSKVDVTDQKCVRINSKRIVTNRVIFALKNDRIPTEYLLLDDDGELIEVSKSIFMMFGYRCYDKVTNKGDKYIARWFTLDGKRVSKKFDDHSTAYAYQRKMIDSIFGSIFKDLNLYKSYFDK
jgi:hypothetical protein